MTNRDKMPSLGIGENECEDFMSSPKRNEEKKAYNKLQHQTLYTEGSFYEGGRLRMCLLNSEYICFHKQTPKSVPFTS